MLKRKFYETLLEWKKNKGTECLLVNGARQVGKTFIIEQFGQTEYESYIYINFIENPEYKKIFEDSLEPSEIYKRMSLYVPHMNLIPGNTLIFLDEIQVCKKARTALKFLAIDDRFDVIGTGSLLGIHYNDKTQTVADDELSIPVGYERELTMHSLDFEEFLWALGAGDDAISILRTHFETREQLDDSVCKHYQNLLREYLVVGGMPEVVNAYLATDNFQRVFDEQEKILKAYEDDIEKYAGNTDKPKIKNVYYSIPRQLAKKYTKFQYKTIERNGSSRKYSNSIDWLIDAGLVSSVSNVSLPEMPLRAYEKPEEFKIYVSDIGLITHMFGFETQVRLLEGSLKGSAKGGIYENLVFDMLSKRGHKLFYYKHESNTQEIEFLIECAGDVAPIEVKSSKGTTVSLNNFIETYHPITAYKLIDGNLGTSGCKVTLPQFMAMFI